MTNLTQLTDEVSVGGRKTTIQAEFNKLHTFRAYSGSGGASPSDTHHVTIYEGGDTATFNISAADLNYLARSGRS
jgi:hypothetical protein